MGGLGSGRRVKSEEAKRHAIIDKAWARVERLIDDPTNKFGDVVAKDLAVKNVPQENINQGDGVKVIIVKDKNALGSNSRTIPDVVSGE